ncbi:STAS domain-containing protein [Streptomyces sp. NPDC046985]|uniref:STAS domain-containing protein n=1 Tax=Streptomyces sp. NPDC046985 TaxID=3155377 RepID=UPI0033CB356F
MRSTRKGPVWVVALRGDFDPEDLDAVEEATAQALDSFDGPVVFDLGALGFCDSSLLNHLIRMANQRSVALVGVGRLVQRLLAVTGLDDYFAQYPDLTTAREALTRNPNPFEQA